MSPDPRLTSEQFQFTRKVSRRQAKIDLLDKRERLFAEYIDLQSTLTVQAVDGEAVRNLAKFAARVDRIYPRPLGDLLRELSDNAMTLVECNALVQAAGTGLDATAARTERTETNRRVRDLKSQVYKALREEIRVEV